MEYLGGRRRGSAGSVVVCCVFGGCRQKYLPVQGDARINPLVEQGTLACMNIRIIYSWIHMQGLLRDYIRATLYHPTLGYFCKQRAPMACLDAPIAFDTLDGRDDYLDVVADHYNTLQHHWLTPAELFRPHIGRSIASYMVGQWDKKREMQGRNENLTIVELGGGTGSLACDILEWLREHRSDLYASCRYESIDISENLARMQECRVRDRGHGPVFRSNVGDACQQETWKSVVNRNDCPFIIGMEVLDNLPHDKVVPMDRGDGDMIWMESCVSMVHDDIGEVDEVFRPVSDACIRHVLGVYLQMNEESLDRDGRMGKYLEKKGTQKKTLFDAVFAWLLDIQGVPEPVFLPTSAYMLFDAIQHAVPHHQLILSDFDYLPDVIIAGEHAPIVSSTTDGKARDRGTLFPPFGSSDIFFPTNFELLKRLYLSIQEKSSLQEIELDVQYEKAEEFFRDNVPDISLATTKSGFVPLLEDYSNTSFLLTKERC